MKFIKFILLCIPFIVFSQETLTGTIHEANTDKKPMPLPGANVFWLDTSIGTVTDFEGKFSIPYKSEYKKLVISYVGYTTDTLTVNSLKSIKHWLRPTSDLDAVTINTKKQSTAKSYLKAENVQIVSSAELLKAACCNLSESFETNPSIDVNFADAVSGTRQIKMLGLTSPYILIAMENIPSVRGASQAYGLSFIPGTWVESIQITKGAGSVVNGFESIAGQINTELVKPTTDDKLFVNAYAASSERLELNTHFNTKLSSKLATGLYVHGNTHQQKHDVNNDGFLDMPLYHQINVMNRWQYTNVEKGLVSFLNVRYLTDKKQSGEINFNPELDKLTTNNWGSEIKTKRFETSFKFGYVNPELTWRSLGVQLAYSHHNQDSYFGLRNYDINHNSFYATAIYNSIISDSRHKIKTGLSFTYDHYDEEVETSFFERSERSLGGFFEYAYDDLDKLTLTAGLRFDMHNLLGEFITPRLHLRYTPWEKSALRFSIGKGVRSASIFTENQKLFATGRTINILNTSGNIYGLNPEVAWNYGVSYLQGFNLFGRKADLTFDFYRTDFKNQVVVDYETVGEVNFYNLQGKSFANSFQVELNYNLIQNLDMRAAYKYYDVQTDYVSGRKVKPLTPKHRFFVNLGWEQYKHNEKPTNWKLDATFNLLKEQRFPGLSLDAVGQTIPNVATLNAQVTRVFSPKFEVYLGGENMTNVRQNNPIVDASNPFGANFDTTFVYGPIFGSMYYAGLRYKLK